MKRSYGNFFLVLLLLVTFPFATATANTIVTLNTSVEISRPEVRLSDVFNGIPPSTDRPIAAAPQPGKSTSYDARILARLAERYHLDWQPQSISDRIQIKRTATYITPEMIQAAVKKKLETYGIKENSEIQFDNRTLEITLPGDRLPVFDLKNFDYDSQSKRFRCELNAETGNSPVTLPVTGRVIIKRDVPVLARRMEAGATIGKNDIDWRTFPEEKLPTGTITDMEKLIGRELRYDTAEGRPISSRDIIMPRLVTRGSIVIMKIQTPYMLITAQGRALQDGTAGEVVRVTNTQSKRVIEGVVEEAGVVRVYTATAQKVALVQ